MSLDQLWTVHVAPDPHLLGRLLARHRERHRRYHTVDHVTAVVHTVVELADTHTAPTPVDLDAVVAAAFYHDAVYEPASRSNERASARLARRDLGVLGWAPARAAHVGDMIEATANHVDPPDIDHALLFDADLAILGAPAPTYDAYVHAVRAEYHHVDDEAWQRGRTEVLESFLNRPSIYSTSTGRERWEQAARNNIATELETVRT